MTSMLFYKITSLFIVSYHFLYYIIFFKKFIGGSPLSIPMKIIIKNYYTTIRNFII